MMENKTATEIISDLSATKKVEELISNITKSPPKEDEEDLAQDIYLALLEKDDKLIEQLYYDNQLIFYITRMLMNNLRSTTSPYYYKYKRHEQNKISINEITSTHPNNEGD